jgi:hypothetical protein
MNQKPQAARLRLVDPNCQDQKLKPSGGAPIPEIPLVPFFIICTSLLSFFDYITA